MSYELIAVEDPEITHFMNGAGQSLLLSAMQAAGVPLDRKKRRLEWDSDREKAVPSSRSWTLGDVFGMLGGFFVATPDECRQIAEQVSRKKPRTYPWFDAKQREYPRKVTKADLKYLDDFCAFCRKAADLGGFYIV